jgi:hypothetical protein
MARLGLGLKRLTEVVAQGGGKLSDLVGSVCPA